MRITYLQSGVIYRGTMVRACSSRDLDSSGSSVTRDRSTDLFPFVAEARGNTRRLYYDFLITVSHGLVSRSIVVKGNRKKKPN